jgi:hypothetical protein
MARKTIFNPNDDFQTANMLGLFTGVSAASSFALEEDMLADTPVIVGTGTISPLLPSDTGELLELFSSDVGNDGAVIAIDALDVDFKPVSLLVGPLSGVGASPLLHPDTGMPFLITRLNMARNVGVRGAAEIVVDLTIRSVVTPANVYGSVKAETQEMQQAIFTVPAGFTWAISSLLASMSKSSGSDTDVTVTLLVGGIGQVMRRSFGFGMQRSGNTTLELINKELQGTGLPVDLMLEAVSTAAGASVSARITIRLVED